MSQEAFQTSRQLKTVAFSIINPGVD